MVAVPAVTPLTTPEEDTVARAVLLLLHTPPEVASARVVVAPVQTFTAVEGVIVPAPAVTLTVAEYAAQTAVVPSKIWYEIISVPGDTPETVPEEVTVAKAVLLLLQPAENGGLSAGSVSTSVPPAHTDEVSGEIGEDGITVTTLVALQLPTL
jgi:hypothetical protein